MAAGIVRHVAELLRDAQQLIVLGHALTARRAARLDLPHACRHGQVGDERVLGLTGAMRDHRPVAVAARQLDALQRLGDRADLVTLIKMAFATLSSMPRASRSTLVQKRSSPTSCTRSCKAAVSFAHPDQSSSARPSSMDTMG